MTIIITGEIIQHLCDEGKLSVCQKPQKTSGDYNYYFLPNIGFTLYNAKVKAVDPKYIVFEYQIKEHLPLLLMLRSISRVLKNYLKRSYYINEAATFYDICFETQETFTLRCYLPQVKGKYCIDVDDGSFRAPRIRAVFDSVTIEVRNVWQLKQKLGFNMELKQVKN
jgi:hypothetical protein